MFKAFLYLALLVESSFAFADAEIKMRHPSCEQTINDLLSIQSEDVGAKFGKIKETSLDVNHVKNEEQNEWTTHLSYSVRDAKEDIKFIKEENGGTSDRGAVLSFERAGSVTGDKLKKQRAEELKQVGKFASNCKTKPHGTREPMMAHAAIRGFKTDRRDADAAHFATYPGYEVTFSGCLFEKKRGVDYLKYYLYPATDGKCYIGAVVEKARVKKGEDPVVLAVNHRNCVREKDLTDTEHQLRRQKKEDNDESRTAIFTAQRLDTTYNTKRDADRLKQIERSDCFDYEDRKYKADKTGAFEKEYLSKVCVRDRKIIDRAQRLCTTNADQFLKVRDDLIYRHNGEGELQQWQDGYDKSHSRSGQNVM